MKSKANFYLLTLRRSCLLDEKNILLSGILALALLLLPRPALGQQLPIFDAHIHYSRSHWEIYSPDAVLKILKRAGVNRAFVSSTPDEGTLRLFRRDSQLVVPVLRPYRTREDMGSWLRDPEIPAYLKERIRKRRGIYRGIGEFHVGPGDVSSEVFRQVAALAVKENLFLHAHTDEVAIEQIARLKPGVCVLWAHAGMTSGPETVGKLLDRHANLWVELSLRWDVSHSGALIPEWQALLLRHPDRFLVGTDTWTHTQWDLLPETLDGYRVWLKTLPRDVAEKIANRNAESLAKPGACARPQAAAPAGKVQG
ncbi:MAG: amidohydrolase family protein [Nitrospinota bacterium]